MEVIVFMYFIFRNSYRLIFFWCDITQKKVKRERNICLNSCLNLHYNWSIQCIVVRGSLVRVWHIVYMKSHYQKSETTEIVESIRNVLTSRLVWDLTCCNFFTLIEAFEVLDKVYSTSNLEKQVLFMEKEFFYLYLRYPPGPAPSPAFIFNKLIYGNVNLNILVSHYCSIL